MTTASNSGTTVRIDRLSKADDRPALFVPCQTDLVDRFRTIYPDIFLYEGRRAIVLDAAKPLPEAELRHCIALALTYKRDRSRKPERR